MRLRYDGIDLEIQQRLISNHKISNLEFKKYKESCEKNDTRWPTLREVAHKENAIKSMLHSKPTEKIDYRLIYKIFKTKKNNRRSSTLQQVADEEKANKEEKANLLRTMEQTSRTMLSSEAIALFQEGKLSQFISIIKKLN